MDFSVDDSMRKKMNSASSRFAPDYWRQIYGTGRFPTEYWEGLAKEGLFGILIDGRSGGLGRSFFEYILTVEETAHHYAGIASYLYLSGALVSQTIEKNGSEQQKQEMIPRFARGELKVSIALGEEASGFNASAIETTASMVGDGSFEINGSKAFVNNVDEADYLIVFARTSTLQSGAKSSGISMFLVDPRDAAITAQKLDKLGMDFIDTYSLQIKSLLVKDEQIIGQVGRAWYNMADIFLMDRIATSASLIGTGRLSLEAAVNRASTRSVFGRPIGANQGIQFPLADSFAQLESAEALTLKAATLVDQKSSFVDMANYALHRSATAAAEATENALQTFGGHGYYKEYDVERYWRDVRVHRIHPLSRELLLATIAEKSLGLPKSY